MAVQIKTLEQTVSEDFINEMVGKTIHVPTNKHLVKQQLADGSVEETKVNAWFAGQVVGYEKAYIKFDFESGQFLDEPKFYYNILLSDGMGYQLSLEESEIVEVTDEEFVTLLAEHQAAIDVEKKATEIILPEKPRLILPGDK